ncbi:uncharacterized protein VICG_00707 [Vittaforma corneae ATCC 50505]|uniref:Uncharacterized protein n=1 Tax=Vittaforma corneae (strain ATCC 50505) TaxID=993615 RepID=L2GPR3_VITCO|nr:uncharacterized protein VICG_00707 [Vittaforma corneae ATCC 50505]ELA42307.1 hypothetical protein VICG_00707 [Vittaforma corneae ATCC 50505]
MSSGINSARSFIEFLSMFEKKGDVYIPKDLSQNILRHFGERTKEGLLLRYEEVLYLYNKNKNPVDLRARMYFDLKNSDYNILFSSTGKAKIYNKRKHFNRKKDKEIGVFEYCKKDECFKDKVREYSSENLLSNKLIAAIESWNDYCLVEITPIKKPNKELNDKKLLK